MGVARAALRRFLDHQMRVDLRPCAVLECVLELQVDRTVAAIKRVQHRRVFFRDEGTAQFSGSGNLIVVRIQILGQQQEAFDALDFRQRPVMPSCGHGNWLQNRLCDSAPDGYW